MKARLIVIAAVGEEKTKLIIGEDNQMPWVLPRDMRFFRTVTEGSTVIMGRKTFESLNKRALRNRRNIVITRQHDYSAPCVEIAHSLEAALALVANESDAFVIGGGELYRLAVPIADHLLVTQIKHKSNNAPLFPVFRGDTFFPNIDEKQWKCVKTSRWFKATSARAPSELLTDRAFTLQFRFLRFDLLSSIGDSKVPAKLFFGKGRLLNRKNHPSSAQDAFPQDGRPQQLTLLEN